MKEKVLEIVRAALSGAEDDLARANMEFGGMTQKELEQQYGFSGKTKGEVWHELQVRRDELRRCLTWVESVR